MSHEAAKRVVAEAALPYLAAHSLVGIGTGTTAEAFIDVLACCDIRIHAAVPSSRRTAERLRAAGIAVIDPTEVDSLPVYVDGADEVDPALRLVKGAGGAATREKLLATMAERFVCVVDESKMVDALGCGPVPVEVLHVAEAFVTRRLREMGGHVVRREGFETDDGNQILDVDGLPLDDPSALERALDALPGVVGHGLFVARPADVVLVAAEDGSVRTLRR